MRPAGSGSPSIDRTRSQLGRGMEKGDRYRELRRWYARDRGVATAEAIADLIVCGSEKQGTSPTRDNPCDRLRAA